MPVGADCKPDPTAVDSIPGKSSKRDMSPSAYRKPCDLCQKLSDVLVRCQIDETLKWHFICPSKCWKQVSGGVIDGPDYEFYKYGGMWKNKHALLSAKKPKCKKNKAHDSARRWRPDVKYIINDRVEYDDKVWICRRRHQSQERLIPGSTYTYWKEAADAVSPEENLNGKV
ncbi:hypothetical protein MMC06_000225 [Schaereria dolodes]|nr:hypothetical protein [Schaereria dolodes]